jgi:hypothetical protein
VVPSGRLGSDIEIGHEIAKVLEALEIVFIDLLARDHSFGNRRFCKSSHLLRAVTTTSAKVALSAEAAAAPAVAVV